MSPKESSSLEAEASPVDVVRQRADAMYRAATECCRQHDRFARITEKATMESEQRAAQRLVTICDESLAELATAYEKCAARVQPAAEEQGWWHRANALWHASREYVRRAGTGARLNRDMASQHDPAMLNDLHVEYELEASALLALRHATDAYRKERPDAH